MKSIGSAGFGSHERGNASVIALIVVVTLLALTGGILAVGLRAHGEQEASVSEHKALFHANSGLADAITRIAIENEAKAEPGGEVKDIGSYGAPEPFGSGGYWAVIEDNKNGSYTVTSTGSVNRQLETIEAVVEPVIGGIYDNAIFSGNSSEDPLYQLGLSGVGWQADEIDGDIFSGGGVLVEGDATVSGTIRATETIEGAVGEEGVTLPIPDLAAMNYDTTADFNVNDEFAGAFYSYDDAGGWAYQLPESNPAHIFRLNPSDRSSDTSATVKDDYFLEDPYEAVTSDSGQDGSNAYDISLSGVSGAPGPNGNQSVYYIDGNLWIHNKKTYSVGLDHQEPDGVQVTFVVKGNIYFSDNVFYQDPAVDGIAFIAMNDDAVKDSGNIYFGDPVFGTLEAMYAFMYAENNFYDNNLDEDGSASVHLVGNMTAGNQVLIERDFGSQHSKLTVDFDDRISTGTLDMPNLPLMSGGGPDTWVVVSWRKVVIQ